MPMFSDYIGYLVQLPVIVGVAGETYAGWISKEFVPFLINPTRWRPWLKKISAGMLVLALVGELVSSMVRDYSFSKTISDLNAKLASLDKQLSKRSDVLANSNFQQVLQNSPVKGKATIEYEPNDLESYEFANKLYYLLYKAGWKVNRPLPVVFPQSSGERLEDGYPLRKRIVGLDNPIVLRSAQAFPRLLADQLGNNMRALGSLPTLCKALLDAGLSPGYTDVSPSMPTDYIEIFIWKK